MRKIGPYLVALAFAAPLTGQFAKFECQAVDSSFPLPGGAPDCEGLVADNGPPDGAAVVVTWTANVPGFPTQGARFALLQAGIAVARPATQPVVRPLPPFTTELRVPIPTGSTYVAFDWAWNNEEGAQAPLVNDGYDFSVCDAAGNRLLQCAFGDTYAHPSGWTPRNVYAATTPPTPAGAYLSCAVFDEGDNCCGSNALAIDDVRFVREAIDFECGPPVPIGAGTCEDVAANAVNAADAAIDATPACGLPVHGAQFMRLAAYGQIDVPPGAMIPRPVASDVTEARIVLPAGATTISFSYAFVNGEGGPYPTVNDGFDVAVVDASGNAYERCVHGDITTEPLPGCNGPYRYFGRFAPLPASAYLSFVVFNGGDTEVPSGLLVDDVSFVDRPTLAYSSPLGPGTLKMTINNGLPGGVYFVPMTLVQGATPQGWLFGLDITLGDLIILAYAGPPFLGFFDATGRSSFGPIGVSIPGLVLYGMPVDDLWATAPRAGYPIRYAVP